MENDNKNTSGAPSSDTTSALFVSARKKQIEQQETERLAKEKEEKRLAAEAEVRRLEQEVADRKRKAEEDAKAAEEEAKRVAEESKAKIAAAASNPDAVLGGQKPASSGFTSTPSSSGFTSTTPKPAPAPKPAAPAATGGTGGGESFIDKLKTNRQLQLICGGALVGVIVIVVVLAIVLGGGNAPLTDEYGNLINEYGEYIDEDGNVLIFEDVTVFKDLIPGEATPIENMGEAPEGQSYFFDDGLGLDFYYPDYWSILARRADPSIPFNLIQLIPEGQTEQALVVYVTDYTKEYDAYVAGGGLDGTVPLGTFITQMYGDPNLSFDYFSVFEFHDVARESNGTITYSAEWTEAETGLEGFGYINIDEAIGKTHAVFIIGELDDYNFYNAEINIITESLESYTTAVG
jgi:hypothetical protein